MVTVADATPTYEVLRLTEGGFRFIVSEMDTGIVGAAAAAPTMAAAHRADSAAVGDGGVFHSERYACPRSRDRAHAGGMPYRIGVHEALEAWRAGEISFRRCMRMTGVGDLAELYAVASVAAPLVTRW
jgi:hypothetical protein